MKDDSNHEEAGSAVNAAIRDLQAAIRSAPVEELTAPLREELGFGQSVDYAIIEEAFKDLLTWANLACPDALFLLSSFVEEGGKFIEHCKESARNANTTGDQGLNSTSLHSSAEWNDKMESATKNLQNLLTPGDNMSEADSVEKIADVIRKSINQLPEPAFSYPLKVPSGKSSSSPSPYPLLTELCDVLIEERLSDERGQILDNITSDAALPPGWNTVERDSDGPLALTREAYAVLEGHRRRSFEAKQSGDIQAKGGTLGNNSHQLDSSNDGWIRSARALPPLSPNSAVIKHWVDVAFMWIEFQHGEDLDQNEWNESINKRIRKTGSTKAGLKRFLTEGFETLSGKNRKSQGG